MAISYKEYFLRCDEPVAAVRSMFNKGVCDNDPYLSLENNRPIWFEQYHDFTNPKDLMHSLYDSSAVQKSSDHKWKPPALEDELTSPPNESNPEQMNPADDDPSWGPQVPYRFRVAAKPDKPQTFMRDANPEFSYTDFAGLRYPTLATGENAPNYWSTSGVDRLLSREHKMHLPAHRRLSPYLREVIWFLHSLDPVRFTKARIAERYRLKEYTVDRIWHIVSNQRFLSEFRLTRGQRRRMTQAEAVLDAKEKAYVARCGYDPIGDQIGKRQYASRRILGGNTSFDSVLKQSIQVEAVSAFPIPSLRDAVKRKFDIDQEVKVTPRIRVINWIDPTDKITI